MIEELSVGMTLIFRTSLHQTEIPNAWYDTSIFTPLQIIQDWEKQFKKL